jgi:hypothetical protein
MEKKMKLHEFERSAVALAAVLGSGLALAASLAEARGRPLPPPPPPATPPARAWHGFTSNGVATEIDSRLYLFGGADSEPKALSDLWYYSVLTGNWTAVVPNGKAKPGPRQHMGWSCGGGGCLLAVGSNGVGLVSESWFYTEATNTWQQVSCRRLPCPSARQMVATAYDPAGVHLMFGGKDSVANFDDTWTFNATTLVWSNRGRHADGPTARNRGTAVFVPGAGTVLLGGQDFRGEKVLCDMFAWRNNGWSRIDIVGTPCLHSHSMAWDDVKHRLVVTGGYTDTSDTRSPVTYYLPFTNGVAGQWATDPDLPGCFTSLHPGARMAFDLPTRKKVFFGGEESNVRYDDTTICN